MSATVKTLYFIVIFILQYTQNRFAASETGLGVCFYLAVFQAELINSDNHRIFETAVLILTILQEETGMFTNIILQSVIM